MILVFRWSIWMKPRTAHEALILPNDSVILFLLFRVHWNPLVDVACFRHCCLIIFQLSLPFQWFISFVHISLSLFSSPFFAIIMFIESSLNLFFTDHRLYDHPESSDCLYQERGKKKNSILNSSAESSSFNIARENSHNADQFSNIITVESRGVFIGQINVRSSGMKQPKAKQSVPVCWRWCHKNDCACGVKGDASQKC